MAHPRANGFFGAKFPAGGIPHAYTLIARKFFDAVGASGHRDRIKLHEYRRDGWTFHGKGLWYSPPGKGERPIATMIGEYADFASVVRQIRCTYNKRAIAL